MLRLAVPSILANITIPLVGIVDTAIAGHISDASAIGGIAIGTMLFDLLYWNFGFLRVGTAGMTAQAWGKEQITNGQTGTETGKILTQSVSIALVAAMLIWLLQYPFMAVAMRCISCSVEVAEFAQRYFFIRIWAAPATLSLMALKGWFIGMQNTISTMITDLVVNIVNMLASWFLAVHTSLGAIGVAWGTLIAQYAGLLTAVILIRHNYLIFIMQNLSCALRWQEMRKLFVFNSNLFVRSLCFMIVYVGFTSLSSMYGNTDLAVSSIMMKLFLLFSYFIDGFAYAGEALTGRFFGERNRLQLNRTIHILLIWTVGIGAVCTILYAVAGSGMVRLITDKQEILLASQQYMLWLVLMPLVSCLAFMWDGIFIGATAGDELRNCMIYSAIGFVFVYVVLQNVIGIQALYTAYFVHLALRAAYLSLRWKKYSHIIE